MAIRNIEIKCKCDDILFIEDILLENGARFIGSDEQVDTYFNTDNGRLKLRQGNIENNLIFYSRDEVKGMKDSRILLFPVKDDAERLKSVLSASFGIFVEVRKKRKIFFIKNIKFHIDEVAGLGHFVEIEAIDESGQVDIEILKQQCQYYIELLQLDPQQFIDKSYSDMITYENI